MATRWFHVSTHLEWHIGTTLGLFGYPLRPKQRSRAETMEFESTRISMTHINKFRDKMMHVVSTRVGMPYLDKLRTKMIYFVSSRTDMTHPHKYEDRPCAHVLY